MLETLHNAIKAHSEMSNAEIIQAAQYGADSGFNGFIYNSDASEFYDKNEAEIYGLLQDDCDSLGHANVDEMVSQFARADMLETPDGRKTLLAWYALETVGRWLLDQRIKEDLEGGEE